MNEQLLSKYTSVVMELQECISNNDFEREKRLNTVYSELKKEILSKMN